MDISEADIFAVMRRINTGTSTCKDAEQLVKWIRAQQQENEFLRRQVDLNHLTTDDHGGPYLLHADDTSFEDEHHHRAPLAAITP